MFDQEFYKTITDLINSIQGRGGESWSYIAKMQTDLGNSELLSTNINVEKLSDQIDATADVVDERHVTCTCFSLNFVEILQEYITEKHGDVNDFIRSGGIQVKPIFAYMSEAVGYPIDADLIEADVSNPSNIS